MMRITLYFWLMLLVITGLQCRKANVEVADVQSIKDFNLLVTNYADLIITTEETWELLLNPGNDSLAVKTSCATISVDTGTKSVTVYFGDTNCVCKDGRYRQGRIYINYSNWGWPIGQTLTVKTGTYLVDNDTLLVTSSLKIERFASFLRSSYPHTLGTADNRKVWNSSSIDVEPVEGIQTSTRWDNVYRLNTRAYYNSMGWYYKVQEPLRYDMKCKWPVSGTVEFLKPAYAPAILDYGNGTYDNTAYIKFSDREEIVQFK